MCVSFKEQGTHCNFPQDKESAGRDTQSTFSQNTCTVWKNLRRLGSYDDLFHPFLEKTMATSFLALPGSHIGRMFVSILKCRFVRIVLLSEEASSPIWVGVFDR